MPSLHDTRLLTNLLKTEKDAADSFKAWTKDAASSSAALVAWSTADSADTQDLMDLTPHLSSLHSQLSHSQSAYLTSLTTYRLSLKHVLERESAIKVILRDREILVGRTMKLGNQGQKVKDEKRGQWEERLREAMEELRACENFLQEEEFTLSNIKRRTFREALAIKMKAMGELGEVMERTSREAVERLERIGGGDDDGEGFEGAYRPEAPGSAAGDSIAPSQSASQALSDDESGSGSEYEEEEGEDHHHHHNNIENGIRTPLAIAPPPPTPAPSRPPPIDRRVSILSTSTVGSASGRRASRSPTREPTSSLVPYTKPIMPAVPTAPRNSILVNGGGGGGGVGGGLGGMGGMPIIDIPKAPANVMSRRPDQDSSDEEDERAFQDRERRLGNVSSPAMMSSGGGAGGGAGRLRKKAMSDTSSINDYGGGGGGGGGRPRRNSFFGGFAALFKSKSKKRDSSSSSIRSMPTSPLTNSNSTSTWETRTDKNVFAATRSSTSTNFIPPELRRPKPVATSISTNANKGNKRGGNDSSDDEIPKNVIRNVNDPMAFRRRTLSIAEPPVTKKMTNGKKVKKASSDIGLPSSYAIAGAGGATAVTGVPKLGTLRKAESVNDVGAEGKKVIKKKKQTTGEQEEKFTAVMIIPGPNDSTTGGAGGLSRNNTVTSARTTGTTGTIKKKKLKSPLSTSSLPPAVPTTSAPDLSSTLPSRSVQAPPPISLETSLPSAALSRRSSTYNPTIGTVAPQATSLPPQRHSHVEPNHEREHYVGEGDVGTEGGRGKVPKSLKENERKGKEEEMRLGNENWVTSAGAGEGTIKKKKTKKVGTSGGMNGSHEEGRQSLMALVEAPTPTIPSSPTLDGPLSRSYAATGATLRPPKTDSTSGSAGLSKRKSVRLIDGPSPPESHVPHSPASSIRSGLGAPPPAQHSILVNPLPPSSSSVNVKGDGWKGKEREVEPDSSDEEDGEGGKDEYTKARKELQKETKGWEKALKVTV